MVGAVSEPKLWAKGQHDCAEFMGLYGAAAVQNLEIKLLLRYVLNE